MTVLIAAG